MELRALRRSRGLRQQDVAALAHVSRATEARVEGGQIGGVTVGTLVGLFEALGARVDVEVRWHGAGLDRLMDEGHARLSGQVASLLRTWAWEVEVEVTFAHFGERGSIDLLAWHPATATLLVIEIKTELGSVEGLLRPLDRKARLAPMVARDRFGWNAGSVSRLVVFPEDATVRRGVARQAGLLDTAFPDGSRGVRRWLREPRGTLRGIWFLSPAHGTSVARNPSSIQRVKRPVHR
jgi:transcriptional regulator with XRE-family HTH domain